MIVGKNMYRRKFIVHLSVLDAVILRTATLHAITTSERAVPLLLTSCMYLYMAVSRHVEYGS